MELFMYMDEHSPVNPCNWK